MRLTHSRSSVSNSVFCGVTTQENAPSLQSLISYHRSSAAQTAQAKGKLFGMLFTYTPVAGVFLTGHNANGVGSYGGGAPTILPG
ncbi:hypothetical protein TNCT_337701 [Trichonephila clavata]|uniref:Uncharacterized protein n=1 Tax=Trichonephila clavata TaxID=2740835 RepID=A0A8X6LQZ5_TRICU|nr:hypothetical protein TNCT_337701 [Trichonephila clavata]